MIAHVGRRRLAGRLLGAGSLLVPAGFFLGGTWPAEGDPALFIVLVPAGAVLALVGLAMLFARS